MSAINISPPQSDEYAPYYSRYIALVGGVDILPALAAQGKETVGLLSAHSESDGDIRYAPGKWSVKRSAGSYFGYGANFCLSRAADLPSGSDSDGRL